MSNSLQSGNGRSSFNEQQMSSFFKKPSGEEISLFFARTQTLYVAAFFFLSLKNELVLIAV